MVRHEVPPPIRLQRDAAPQGEGTPQGPEVWQGPSQAT